MSVEHLKKLGMDSKETRDKIEMWAVQRLNEPEIVWKEGGNYGDIGDHIGSIYFSPFDRSEATRAEARIMKRSYGDLRLGEVIEKSLGFGNTLIIVEVYKALHWYHE